MNQSDQFSTSDQEFTVVVLPDTQFYCDTRLKLSKQWGNGDLREYFSKQTRWVRENRERLNIVFLLHEGDIVQTDHPDEWEIARDAMSILDGSVPYCMCLGDHDMGFKENHQSKYGGEKATNRNTEFNKFFPLEKFSARKEFGGTFESGVHDNSWYHFESGGMKFMVVSLEYYPRNEVLDWANDLVSSHPEYRVIVLTHAYLKREETREVEEVKIQGNHGEDQWQKLIRKHQNIFLVLCGHHYGEASLTSVGDHGNQVYQLLSDYQHLNDGGESWLRYMVFRPKDNKISIYTYNPVLDMYQDGPLSRFDLPYTMLGKSSQTRTLS